MALARLCLRRAQEVDRSQRRSLPQSGSSTNEQQPRAVNNQSNNHPRDDDGTSAETRVQAPSIINQGGQVPTTPAQAVRDRVLNLTDSTDMKIYKTMVKPCLKQYIKVFNSFNTARLLKAASVHAENCAMDQGDGNIINFRSSITGKTMSILNETVMLSRDDIIKQWIGMKTPKAIQNNNSMIKSLCGSLSQALNEELSLREEKYTIDGTKVFALLVREIKDIGDLGHRR